MKAAELLVLATYWVLNLILKYFKSMKNGRKKGQGAVIFSYPFILCNVTILGTL